MFRSLRALTMLACAWLGSYGAASAQPASDMLGAIRARGYLLCGVAGGTVGFSLPDSQGVMRGLDADGCRAVAAAVLGDAEKVRFVPTTAQNRFTALQSGEVDMLVRNTTWTLGREAALGLEFASVNFYDGTGFMVKTESGVREMRQLNGASVCVQPGSTTELNLADYFRSHGMSFSPLVIADLEELRAAFINGRCDAFTTDASSLAAFRYAQGPNADKYFLIPGVISKEPLGSVVRKGDFKFFDVVRWTHFAQLTAEELGITSKNLDSFADSNSPEVQRFLGRTGDLGKMLGLQPDWAVQIVRQVGNFGEMWDRNIGPLGVDRGINNLWNKGGIQYAPPMR
ncbi:amino acid ABC transporter substrate-binding protein [Pseudoroseomonas sp. WGS1072]|uniref:amino acid ABC transporter substrate-binding protein n=1 Tax=Roseomonas sp. WGS1072 TaxID=3366816 RepID=UPI003BF32DC8